MQKAGAVAISIEPQRNGAQVAQYLPLAAARVEARCNSHVIAHSGAQTRAWGRRDSQLPLGTPGIRQ